jgi:hypothetical protein
MEAARLWRAFTLPYPVMFNSTAGEPVFWLEQHRNHLMAAGR